MVNSPVRWLTNDQYANASAGERVVAVADSQVGVLEKPKGSNDGPEVRMYLATVGLGGGYSWCSAFVKWCARRAGIDEKFLGKITGMAHSWIDQGRATGRLHKTPKRGMVGAYKRKDGSGHAWICLSGAVFGLFRTIEGNSNDDGSPNGYKVVKRLRTMRSVTSQADYGFVDLGGLH